MKIFRHADLVPVPWKNGGGVTREIVRHDAEDQIIWRLSIADVALPGPFSAFPGLRRILTVIEGSGMRLERHDGASIAANLFEPVSFSGDEQINGVLPNGPCRDFNVIWDPKQVGVSVTRISGQANPVRATAEGETALLCLGGAVLLSTGQTLATFDCAFLDSKADTAGLTADSSALVICISPLSKL